MNIDNISEEQIFNAYKKLKHYFFYDNTTLFVREKIADFEAELLIESAPPNNIKQILANKVRHSTRSIFKDDSYLDETLKIDILPKKIKRHHTDIVTNNSKEFGNIEVERFNFFIDAPIEVHILSTLWVMFAGRYLSNTLGEYCYANKLNLDLDQDDLPQENLKLFKPYFVQYQQWRDDAIKKAENLLDEKRNVTILSLDIKDFFHNIELNFKEIKNTLNVEIEKFFNYKDKTYQAEHLKLALDLTFFLSKVHERYYLKLAPYLNKINENFPESAKDKYPLPIGLLSSGFLGNYYLKDFDQQIIQNINPAFYGRYVDDLMFVFSDLDSHIKPNLISPTTSFIYDNFVRKNILKIDASEELAKEVILKQVNENTQFLDDFNCIQENNKTINLESYKKLGLNKEDVLTKLAESIIFKLCPTDKFSCGERNVVLGTESYSRLIIQAQKIVLHFFNWKESRAVLNIFKKRLEQQRSEFRFLPDEDQINDEFDEEAFSLRYNDSENKFRSIEDFSENKYGASKFLAKKIFAISLGDKEDDEVTDKQILTFFKEATALSFYSLWEKVTTYFIIRGRGDKLIQFKRNVELAIEKLKSKDDQITTALKKHLVRFLDVSLSIAMALNPKMKFEFLNKNEEDWLTKCKKNVIKIRSSNLFRSSLISIPCINYTKYILTDGNLLDNDFNKYFSVKDNNLDNTEDSSDGLGKIYKGLHIDSNLALLAPNYIPFHEVNILKIIETVTNLDEQKISQKITIKRLVKSELDGAIKEESDKYDLINSIPDLSFTDYYKLNYSWKQYYSTEKKEYYLREKYFSIKHNDDERDKVRYTDISIKGENDENYDHKKIDKKIAIANLKVESENMLKSIDGRPNLKKARRKTIFKLLNDADRLNSDMIVFPEVSIPYSWLRLLAERSHKRYLGIAAGLEHWINNKNIAFNFMVTILPFKVHNYTTSLIKIRLKNHYSHAEKHLLKGYRLLSPEDLKTYKMSYDLFHWRNTYFSVYNCFELADIYHRSLFKSKVDFLVASEYNQDTSYFSDIAGAWVRDVHAYFIQVNSSDFGDSRLLQPAKSYLKDLIQVKGGENSTVLVGTLEIEKIRKFQFAEYHLQKDFIASGKYVFKPTPPDFERENVKKRMKNLSFSLNLIETKNK